jgi:hypothetical protein
MKEFIMSSEILWYIWIVGKAYLQVGLLSALILLIVTFDNSEMNRVTLKELIFTIFFHPIVIYYFIKEWNGINRRK